MDVVDKMLLDIGLAISMSYDCYEYRLSQRYGMGKVMVL